MSEDARKLYRSRSDRILFGVCGGLGNHFSIEPALVRLAFILLCLANGIGFVLYIILRLLLREEPGEPVEIDREESVRGFVNGLGKKTKELVEEIKTDQHWFREPKNLAGTVLVLIGAILLIKQIFPFIFNWADWNLIWGIIILIVGFFLILRK